MGNDKKKMLEGNGNNLNTGSFASFAQTMNNNAMIDNGNPAQMLRGALGSAPKLGDAVGVNTGGLPEGGTATGAETGTVEGGAATGDVTSKGEAVTGTGTAVTETDSGTAVQAQPISGIPLYSGSVGRYEDWMSKNGYDPDTDYKDAQAALEYDYMTSMANYGRRAEELAQMGLSNSGLSDIYQLGAYNSYLQSQNELANQLIAAKKKYRQEYNAIKTEEETAIKTDTANAYNIGLDLLAYDEDGTSNADYVRQQLINRGYDASVVDSAMQMLMGLDKDTLPVMKQRAQAKKEASEQRERDIASVVSTWLANGYTTSMEQTVRDALAAEGKDQEYIDAVISRLTPYGKENVKRADESDINTAVQNVVDNGYGGTKEERDQIEKLYTSFGWSAKKVEAMLARLDAVVAPKTETEVAKERSDTVSRLTTEIESKYGKYGYSSSTKEEIRQAYAGTEYEEYLDEVFELHAENVEETLKAEISDLQGALDEDSPNSDELFANAYKILRISEDTWNGMSDEDKTLEIIVGIKEIDDDKAKEAFANWYVASVGEIDKASDTTDKIEMVNNLIEQVKYLAKNRVITQSEKKEIIEGENGLNAFYNSLMDAEIRGTIRDVGTAYTDVAIRTMIGPLGWVLGGAHDIGSLIVDSVKK